jgi:predicted permease
MVVLQLALALALLAGSELIVRGFLRVRAVSPGFDADGVLVATVALSWDRVAELERRTAFTAGVLERLRAIPGVESAAMINSLPFSGSNQQQTFEIAGKPLDERSPPFASLRGVSPQYVRTMRIPLLRGREFIESDLAGPMRVVLINEALAGSYLAGGDAVGQRLVLFGGDVNAEIVGVVDNVRHFGLDQDVMPEIYFPYTADFLTSKSYVVRTSGDPHALAAAVRAAIHEVDPAQPLRAAGPDHAETMTLASMIDESLAGPRFYTLVLVLLSSVALVLAAVGLFGVVAISVTERQREIGLRMALGAERMSVLMWILGRIGRVAALAMACGLLIIFATGSTIEAFLHGVSARDPVALTLAITTFCAITIVAVVLPASRVLQLDAARVLRQE